VENAISVPGVISFGLRYFRSRPPFSASLAVSIHAPEQPHVFAYDRAALISSAIPPLFPSLTPIPKPPAFIALSRAPKRGVGRRYQRWVRDAVDAAASLRVFHADGLCRRGRRSAASVVKSQPDPPPHPLEGGLWDKSGREKARIPIIGIILDSYPNHLYHARIPSHQEGRLAIVTKRGAGCGGRGSADNERHCCVRRRRVVLTPQGRRQVRGGARGRRCQQILVTGESTT
jgi:hypothetical protein